MGPARKAPNAKIVLADLVARTIPTLTGKPNRIIRLEGDHVYVGTTRSPEGRAVDISDIQMAIDRLYAAGELYIAVETVGYRSALSEQ